MEFGTVGNRHTDVTYTRIFSWNGQRLVQEAWQDSDWGVPGIVVEQCARRKLFRAGTLDSNQRRRTLPLWILWCVMLSFHQRRGWGIHTPRQKTDERENNIFFTDHSSVRVLAVTQLKLCRIQAGRTRCGFSFRDQRLFYVPLLHWVWKVWHSNLSRVTLQAANTKHPRTRMFQQQPKWSKIARWLLDS